MNLQCWYKRVVLTRSHRYTLPVGNWRYFFILVCGLLLLIPVGFNGQLQVNAAQSHLFSRMSGSPSGIERSQVDLPFSIRSAAYSTRCDRLGWYPVGFGLKDHSVFIFDGFYYLASIRTPGEKAFAYARSTDLCNWEDLGPIFKRRISGEWDDTFVWAPFVLEENGVFYMYYTGVRRDFTQSIMLATSTNPADPGSWQPQGMIFQPNHDGMLWHAGGWADSRDASVAKMGDIYYMVYTGRDTTGPIIGWATAFNPAGPWHDWGAVLTFSQLDTMAESPLLVSHAGAFYLFYNKAYQGEEYRIGQTQVGPWSDAISLPSGWANEMWTGQDGLNYTSFAQSHEIIIKPYIWDDFYTPPRLFMGASTHRLFFPILFNP